MRKTITLSRELFYSIIVNDWIYAQHLIDKWPLKYFFKKILRDKYGLRPLTKNRFEVICEKKYLLMLLNFTPLKKITFDKDQLDQINNQWYKHTYNRDAYLMNHGFYKMNCTNEWLIVDSEKAMKFISSL